MIAAARSTAPRAHQAERQRIHRGERSTPHRWVQLAGRACFVQDWLRSLECCLEVVHALVRASRGAGAAAQLEVVRDGRHLTGADCPGDALQRVRRLFQATRRRPARARSAAPSCAAASPPGSGPGCARPRPARRLLQLAQHEQRRQVDGFGFVHGLEEPRRQAEDGRRQLDARVLDLGHELGPHARRLDRADDLAVLERLLLEQEARPGG